MNKQKILSSKTNSYYCYNLLILREHEALTVLKMATNIHRKVCSFSLLLWGSRKRP